MDRDAARSCANDELANLPVESSAAAETIESRAELLSSAFDTAFHMSGVKAYLEYYELR